MSRKNVFHTIVCGSGPAGLSAALASVESGFSTVLLEKEPSLSRKLLAAGNGKCNFSNTFDDAAFMAAFGRNGRFMSPALACGGKEWLLPHLEKNHVPFTVVDGTFYFPASMRGCDFQNAFLLPAQKLGLVVRTRSRVKSLVVENDTFRQAVLSDGTVIEGKRFILASGGSAMPALGGSNDGLRLAEQTGHTITPPLPAMAPVFLQDQWAKDSCGIALPEAVLTLSCGSTHLRTQGSLLFTHDGISGMAALNISDTLYRCFKRSPEKVRLSLNFFAGKSFSDYVKLLREIQRREPEKQVKNALGSLIPNALAGRIVSQIFPENILFSALKNSDIDTLAKHFCAMPLHPSGICPMEKAMAMSGGVSLKEVDPDTMQSKICSGIFFAGEILDLTGPCGGFNIQFAVASGRLAGLALQIRQCRNKGIHH